MTLYGFDGKPATFRQARLFGHEDLPLFTQPDAHLDRLEGALREILGPASDDGSCGRDCAECPAFDTCEEK